MYGEDETTLSFQKRVAQLTGKEAALFCTSGTMANQLAIRSWLQQPPYSILCDERAHVHQWETGGIAAHSQAQTIPVQPTNGLYLTWDDIEPKIVVGCPSNALHEPEA